MAHRALIIAIEEYPDMAEAGLSATLDGTIKSALEFNAWLIRKWQREGRTLADTDIVFCSEPVQAQVPAYRERPSDPDRFAPGFAATKKAVIRCLRDLKERGATSTEELFVYLSGHGFSFSAMRLMRTDYLITSDFESADLSADCSLNLTQLMDWLRMHLVNGRHFYFVDACRNELTARQIVPGPLGLGVDPQSSGDATTYIFQSARPGATTVAASVFAPALLTGLEGAGVAKEYPAGSDEEMVVTFSSLRKHLSTTLGDQAPSAKGDENEDPALAVLTTLKPPPTADCTVRVSNWQPGDQGVVSIKRGRGAVETRPLVAGTVALKLPADDYAIGVQVREWEVAPGHLVKFNGYVGEPATLPFSKVRPMALGGGLGAVPTAPPELELAPAPRAAAPTGPAWAGSVPHESIAARLPHDDHSLDFSESLGGWVDDSDLDVWLAILGGGRILGKRAGDYHKIARFPLYDFSQESAGAAPFYVLCAFEQETAVQVSVAEGAEPQWRPVVPVERTPGLAHVHVPSSPGPKLVSLRLPGHATWTYASIASANRATLITLTLDEEGDPRLSQYLLPLGSLVDHLRPEVASLVKRRVSPLADVRSIAAAGRAFRRRGDIGRELPTPVFDELCYAKWVDPIGSVLAAYQFVRRGEKNKLGPVVSNLRHYFPELPDSAALSRLAGTRVPRPPGVPLFLDGLRAYPDYAEWLPLPAGLLHFEGPWTAWRDAV